MGSQHEKKPNYHLSSPTFSQGKNNNKKHYKGNRIKHSPFKMNGFSFIKTSLTFHFPNSTRDHYALRAWDPHGYVSPSDIILKTMPSFWFQRPGVHPP